MDFSVGGEGERVGDLERGRHLEKSMPLPDACQKDLSSERLGERERVLERPQDLERSERCGDSARRGRIGSDSASASACE